MRPVLCPPGQRPSTALNSAHAHCQYALYPTSVTRAVGRHGRQLQHLPHVATTGNIRIAVDPCSNDPIISGRLQYCPPITAGGPPTFSGLTGCDFSRIMERRVGQPGRTFELTFEIGR